MKMSARDFEIVKTAIEGIETDALRRVYRAGDFPRADLVKNLDKRYRWDLLHGAYRPEHDPIIPQPLIQYLYDQGYNDTHIDTALRAIVRPL
jgi:hypothetical protein